MCDVQLHAKRRKMRLVRSMLGCYCRAITVQKRTFSITETGRAGKHFIAVTTYPKKDHGVVGFGLQVFL